MPVLAALVGGFKIWMLVDAARRGGCCNNVWYLVILLPFGEWAYFFMVKVHDPQFSKLRSKFFSRPQNLEALRYEAAHCPSIVNKMNLARSLLDNGLFSESKQIADDILDRHQSDKEATFISAVSMVELGEVADGIVILEQLIADNFAFRDYSAASELVRAYEKSHQTEKRIGLLHQLVAKSNQTNHRAALVRSLLDKGKKAEAQTVLNEALVDYQHAPRYIQKRHRGAWRELRELQKRMIS